MSSWDPNVKLGPTGFGAANSLTAGASLPYRIKFENFGPGSVSASGAPVPSRSWATAPAQEVEITDQLSSSLDWSTFAFTGFGFGETIQAINLAQPFIQTVLPVTIDGKNFEVHVEGSIDLATGGVRALFSSIDPQTSLPPDVLTGFLPPEDGTGIGQGFIEYVVKPKANLPSGTQIRNVANIRFDVNPIISTDQIDPLDASKGTDPNKEALVTIDSGAPTSSVAVLPPTSEAVFPVEWYGNDDTGGSGIASYDIYVSTDGGPFLPWLLATTNTIAAFQGAAGSTYAFYSIARDYVGNTENPPSSGQTSTTISPSAPLLIVSVAQSATAQGNQITISFPTQPGKNYTVEFRDDLGPAGVWKALPGAPQNSGSVTEPPLEHQRYYRVRATD